MKIFNSYRDIPENARGHVVAIGNFDGVHKGHQALLAHARSIADDLGKKLSVLTFEPHPRSLFRPDEPPFRITPAPLKQERMDAIGIDYMVELGFDWDFASQSAENFVRDILIDGLNAAHIVVGHDFCFGQLRKGNPDTIRAAGMDITVLEKICDDGSSALSSSRIRQALKQGLVDEANSMLGWGWEIRGEIIKGDQRGRELGFPTANMDMGTGVHPAYGVYAVLARIEGEDSGWIKGAANIGIRPMFEVPIAQVETYLFDFSREIYGKTLCVRPVRRLRGEARFASLDELIAQMNDDCAQARAILS